MQRITQTKKPKEYGALIVDDTTFMRTLLASTLKSEGIVDIYEAASAREVAQFWSANNEGSPLFDNPLFSTVTSSSDKQPDLPELVFLDIHLTGESKKKKTDGLQILKELRQHSKDAFVIMVSSDSHVEVVRKALELGANGYLVKPVSKGNILKAITQFEHYRKQRLQKQ